MCDLNVTWFLHEIIFLPFYIQSEIRSVLSVLLRGDGLIPDECVSVL